MENGQNASSESAAKPAYEYIVVGSGAGGGLVAANLAEAGHRVLLLEAGADQDSLTYQVPAFHPGASEDPDMSWEFFVRHYADEEQQRRDWKYAPKRGGVFYPRAAALGGCTAHHAMILLYPNNSDWDAIADETGDESWRAARMRRYFQRLEECRYRGFQRFLQRLFGWNPSRHGFDGWLTVTKADPRMALGDKRLLRLVFDAAIASLLKSANPIARILYGLCSKLDPNGWRLVKGNRVGLRIAPLSIRDGKRIGSRERIQAVRQSHPDQLDILTGALATRVLFDPDDKTRAIGVEYLRGRHLYAADPNAGQAGPGALHQVTATREVILCGGAFNTPQLLQLSGICPPELLGRPGIDIEVRVPLKGVGANLQDRYEVTVISRMKQPFALLDGATMVPPGPGQEPDPQMREWLDDKQGPYTTNGAVIALIQRSKAAEHAGRSEPDLFLFGLVTDFRGYYQGYSRDIQAAHRYFTWAVLKGHTNNRNGRVAIRSNNPLDTPEIDFHYFEEGSPGSDEDLAAVVEAVQYVRDISAGYQDMVAEETQPGPSVRTPEQIAEFVRNQAWGHHASCTCKIGHPSDPEAVVDSKFRVLGTSNLRVVDASVFPRIPGLFIVSAVYMIAEKASEDILAAARAG
jgi:choline dehydrogenase